MRNYSIDMANEQLPVGATFQTALQEYGDLYKELAQLPQDPKDPLMGLDVMLEKNGVQVGTNYGQFIMGGLEQVAINSALSHFGVAANSPANMAIDVATTAFAQRREEKEEAKPQAASKNDSRKASVKSVFERYTRKAPVAKRRAPAFATSMLMASSMKKKAPTQRQVLRRQDIKARMTKIGHALRDLSGLKAMGIEYATRMNLFDPIIGQNRPMLVEATGTQKVALTPQRQRATLSQDNSPQVRKPAGQQLRFG